MPLFKFNKANDNKDLSDRINRYIVNLNKKPLINIVSSPYSDIGLFFQSIFQIINSGGKVLYITNEDEQNINLVKKIKKDTDFRDYYYFRSTGKFLIDKKLIITNHFNASYIGEAFDLIVYDDISVYSGYTKEEIEKLLLSKKALKYVAVSIEEIFDDGQTFESFIRDNNIPFAEPRIINTRIDISKDMPYVVYEYLQWFVKFKRNVIIYVPDGDKREGVYSYLSSLNPELSDAVLNFKDDEKKVLTLLKEKEISTIAVTNDMYNIPVSVNNLDIVVYFCDDSSFNYKKLVFICGRVGVNNTLSSGEVIFLSNTTTYDMEKAKDITRSFNKIAWEKGFLKV